VYRSVYGRQQNDTESGLDSGGGRRCILARTSGGTHRGDFRSTKAQLGPLVGVPAPLSPLAALGGPVASAHALAVLWPLDALSGNLARGKKVPGPNLLNAKYWAWTALCGSSGKEADAMKKRNWLSEWAAILSFLAAAFKLLATILTYWP
jgi:hypothetical protein